MDEKAIAEQQKANIPQPTEHTPAPVTPPEATGFGDAEIGLDEITQFKLHDVFDAKYEEKDEDARRYLQFIYERASDMAENKEYPFVVAKIREVMRIAGIAHSDRKMFKTYQWLKLAGLSKNINKQMENLGDG